MIADDGSPVLMDFGSAMKARIRIETRSQALLQQDLAAEQCTMAYRAPELFDVKTGVALDEKVDIWVSPVDSFAQSAGSLSSTAVARLHAIRARLLAFAIREYADDRTGWFNRNGCHECTIQTSAVRLFPRPEEPHRQHAEGEPNRPARHPQGTSLPTAFYFEGLS